MIDTDGKLHIGHSDVIHDARARFATTPVRRRLLAMIVLRSVGFTYQDIADAMDASKGTVRTSIRNGIERLRSELELPAVDDAKTAESLAALLRDQQADDASDYVDYANVK